MRLNANNVCTFIIYSFVLNEYKKATEYKSDYLLVVVSNLVRIPKLSIIENPTEKLELISREQKSVQLNYYSDDIHW